ncbi:hypothetical protein BDZ85DRAFT_263576 [Elsinoe ampelina]|uniref:Uncharacterized protein n=1 Tax=Elsinoe ampelina TaxID=302913 RepID=A0A6A6G9K9_9PEZI|nr:hypothetical protein BDZ85DRAFT_263576 [Elsinoe ampelina]
MYARQTLQAVGPGRPYFRLLVRQCRRQRPTRFYSNGRDDGESEDSPLGRSRQERANQQSQQIEDLDRSNRRAAVDETGTWGAGSGQQNDISPEVERERTAMRNATTRATASTQSTESAGTQETSSENEDPSFTPIAELSEGLGRQPKQPTFDLSPRDQAVYDANPGAYFVFQNQEGDHIMRPKSELESLGLEVDEIEAINNDPRTHLVLQDDDGEYAVVRLENDVQDEDDFDFADSQPSPGTLELGLSEIDLRRYKASPGAFLLISSPDGPLLRPRSDLGKLGLSEIDRDTYLSNPSAFMISQNNDGTHTVELYSNFSSDLEEDDLEEEDEERVVDRLSSGIEIESTTEEEDDDIDEANTLQRDLHDLETYDKHEVTPIPFFPAETSKEQYLRAGRGNATISAANFEGVVQDRIKALTDKRQNDFRYAPDIAKRMMRGGLVSFQSEKERDEVVAAAQDYAYKLKISASKARKGKDEVAEHEFAPLSDSMQSAIVARYVKGKYWEMSRKRYDSDLLNQVSAAVAQNNTYLGRDSAVFMKKLQAMVAPPRQGEGQKQARKQT